METFDEILRRAVVVRPRFFDPAELEPLRAGRPMEDGYGRRAALVIVAEPEGPAIAWDVRRASNGAAYAVRLRRAEPGAESSGVERLPRLDAAQIELDVDALEAIFAELAAAAIRPSPPSASGELRGTLYEVVLPGAGIGEARFRWTGAPPAGWEALAIFADRLLRLCASGAARP